MDASLARGHARAAIAALPSIVDVMEHTVTRGIPPRVLLPMGKPKTQGPPKTGPIFAAHRAHLHPSTSCFVAQWAPNIRLVVGLTVTKTSHLPLIARDGSSALVDVEAMVLLRTEGSLLGYAFNLPRESYAQDANFTYGTSASLSRHALQRMLQRGGTTPDRVAHDTRRALVLADTVQRHAQLTKQIFYATGNTFLLPWKDGALVASATRIRMAEGGNTAPHMAIRTYLDGAKLSPRDKQRMVSLKAILDAYDLLDLAAYHSGLNAPSPKGPERATWKAALEDNGDQREYAPTGQTTDNVPGLSGPRLPVSTDAFSIRRHITTAAKNLPGLFPATKVSPVSQREQFSFG